jgi:photosynthesis system II assembly factor YCF48-like protein
MAEIPKIVERRMRAVAKHQGHPDPDLLNAFAEKSLGKREQVQVLEHLYACTECREVVSLSTMQPEFAGGVSAAAANPRWLAWPVLRWGAVAACVVVAGAVVTLRQRQEVHQPARNEVVATVPSKQFTQASRPASAPVVMADARTGSQLAEMVPGRAKEALAESQETKAEKAMSGAGMARRQNPAQVLSDVTPAENLTPRWTLSSGGTLQRSLDSGRSWQTIPLSIQTTFRALAANGLDIWVGGSAGALYHSSDAGQHWSPVQPAVDGESLIDDVIGVQFTDTLHGKLTTSNDETWTTADAGQTWRKQ